MVYGTDDCDPDFDGDLIGDGDEIALGLDPTDEDSDGDGASDGYEVGDASAPEDTDSDGDIDALDTDDDGRLRKHELQAVGTPRRAASGAVRCEAGTGLQLTACCADEG